MNIRAHHLLCMKYFKGKGYSEEFVSNFSKIIKKLQNNPFVKVINSPDIICSHCPRNKDNKCIKKGPDSEKKVKRKDNIVIKHLGIELNQKIRAEDARKLVNLKLNDLKKLCKECEWKQYCN